MFEQGSVTRSLKLFACRKSSPQSIWRRVRDVWQGHAAPNNYQRERWPRHKGGALRCVRVLRVPHRVSILNTQLHIAGGESGWWWKWPWLRQPELVPRAHRAIAQSESPTGSVAAAAAYSLPECIHLTRWITSLLVRNTFCCDERHHFLSPTLDILTLGCAT